MDAKEKMATYKKFWRRMQGLNKRDPEVPKDIKEKWQKAVRAGSNADKGKLFYEFFVSAGDYAKMTLRLSASVKVLRDRICMHLNF